MTATHLTVPKIDELLAQARGRTGLSDFGAPSFRLGLDRMLRSISEEAERFTPEGVANLADIYVERLSQRLRIEDWYARHPETEDQQPDRPLLITGLPRTGTSAFANILSIEPELRCLRTWEQREPVPPPAAEGWETDPRRLATMESMEVMRREAPEQMTMHIYELDATNEDVVLMQTACQAQIFTAPLFSYSEWWRDSDMTPAYAFQRRVVKLLQSGGGSRRWLFKGPHYKFHLEAVAAAYPDGRFVVTHRDPVKCLPSWSSLLVSLYPPGSRERTPLARLGEAVAQHQAIGLRRMIEARRRLGEERFLDVRHWEFVADPIGVLRRVYDFTGLTMTAETEQRMSAWSEHNRPGAHGEHRYSLAQFGMVEADIRERFAFYTDHYQVRLETA
jgi:hypothetical protein